MVETEKRERDWRKEKQKETEERKQRKDENTIGGKECTKWEDVRQELKNMRSEMMGYIKLMEKMSKEMKEWKKRE